MPYLDDAFGYIRQRVRSEEDARDVLQESMLAAWQGFHQYHGDAAFRTWLYGIIGHKINDFYRKVYRCPAQSWEELLDEMGDGAALDSGFFQASDVGEEVANRLDVKDTLARLPEGEKQLVLLIFQAEMTYSEVSRLTGIPIGTIKSRMSAIRAKLKKWLT